MQPRRRPIASPVVPKENLDYSQVKQPRDLQLDAEYVAVDLPSNYAFYDFKTVYIKPFKMKHLTKLVQGQSNKNVRYMAEVLNSVIKCDLGYDDTVFRLTNEDFLYLQYWERLHSLPNIPFNHVSLCNNPEHLKKVEQGKLKEESLRITTQIAKANLEVKHLPQDFKINFNDYISDELRALNPTVKAQVPVMRDYLDMLELAEADVVENPDQGQAWFLSGVIACLLSAKDEQGNELPFKAKYQLVEELSPESWLQLRELQSAVPEYGVTQWVNARCTVCGALSKTKVVLNASSFLPEHYTPRNSR